MKSCPTCNRTYPDDMLAFCLVDGSVLSPPYDPGVTKPVGASRDTAPPATEVFNPGASLDSLPPTQAAPRDVQSTIRAPFQPQPAYQHHPSPPQTPDYLQNRSDYAPRKSSIIKRVLIVLALVVVLLIAAFVLLLIFGPRQSNIQNNMPPRANSNASSSNRVGKQTLAEAAVDDEATIREQLRQDPDNAHLNRQLASDLCYEGKYSEAETSVRKAIQIEPNSSSAHYILAEALRNQNKKAEAAAEQKVSNTLAAEGR